MQRADAMVRFRPKPEIVSGEFSRTSLAKGTACNVRPPSLAALKQAVLGKLASQRREMRWCRILDHFLSRLP